MRHVLDLDGEWFAMSLPEPGTIEWLDAELRPSRVLPAVGDVLANVRTRQYDFAIVGAGWDISVERVWANPPFVRVAEVLPMVDGNPDDWPDRHVVVGEPYDEPTVLRRTASRQWVGGETVACWLLGGWAVRVEEADLRDAPDGWILHDLTRRPPRFDGPPLNQGGRP